MLIFAEKPHKKFSLLILLLLLPILLMVLLIVRCLWCANSWSRKEKELQHRAATGDGDGSSVSSFSNFVDYSTHIKHSLTEITNQYLD